MAVYLFTYHAYRSWSPANPRGYVKRTQGILPRDAKMAQRYDEAAKHPAVRFDRSMQQVMCEELQALCAQQSWRLHYACITATHVHVLVSWETFIEFGKVRLRLKQRLGRALSVACDQTGPWFVQGSSRKQVRDHQHFDYLRQRYLPRKTHRGVHYCEQRGVWEQ